MASKFVKVYDVILHSSVWLEEPETRIVFLTMLIMADENGDVAASLGGLAHAARVSREKCERAIQTLTSPDPDSRTKDLDGRRIVATDGGWHVVNHRKYRDKRTQKQIGTAERVRRHRERKATALPVTNVTPVTPEAEAEAEADQRSRADQVLDLCEQKSKDQIPNGRLAGLHARADARTREAAAEAPPAPDSESTIRPVGLEREYHPDEEFVDRVSPIAVEAYVPSDWLVDAAMASGLDATALGDTLVRYRKRSKLATASQATHDKAFKGWLKNQNFVDKPPSVAPPAPAEKRAPPVHPNDAAGYALKPPWHPDFKKQEAK